MKRILPGDLFLILSKLIRLQNTNYVNVFDYIKNIKEYIPKIENISYFAKQNNFLEYDVLGKIENINKNLLNLSYDQIKYIYLSKKKAYVFNNEIENTEYYKIHLDKKNNLEQIYVPIFIEKKDIPKNKIIKIGVFIFEGKDLKLKSNILKIKNIILTIIFFASVFSSISQMLYKRYDKLTSMIARNEFEFEINNVLLSKPKQISILMLDIDHFKKINDTYGHKVGDKILSDFSKIILKNIRSTNRAKNIRDIPLRWGGEEFVIILCNTNLENSLKIAERIKKNVEKNNFIINKKIIKITTSIGVINSKQLLKKKYSKKYILNLISLADQQLYFAKNSGRNKICVYNE